MKRGNLFRSVSIPRRKRTSFDLSFENKLSMQMGKIVPIFTKEVLPGDTFKVNTSFLIRFAPMTAPIMHRVDAYVHYFFVPNRLIWNEWKEFITGGQDGNAQPEMPYVTASTLSGYTSSGGLCDYIGVPYFTSGSINPSMRISTLPFRAYQLIWNEYFRDQNLTPPVEISLDSGYESTNLVDLFKLRNRSWQKDYFTSALPWTQRGPEVTIPLTGELDVSISQPQVQVNVNSKFVQDVQHAGELTGNVLYDRTDMTNVKLTTGNGDPIEIENSAQANITKISGTVDASKATAVDMNSLRRAMRLQEWLENNARGGARYIEQILSHFGVRSSDARLQRPEYLGGGKTPVVISEVLQNSATLVNETPQGNMAGHGVSVGTKNGFKCYFEEHGFVIGVLSVLPRTCYQQGLHKMFRRMDKLDFYWPEFAHLGEQAVLMSELYANTIYPDEVFGYQSRYAEYKFNGDEVHGVFKDSLDYWHLGRIFSNKPALNTDFVTTDSETFKRIFAVREDSTEDLYVDIFHDFKAKRVMPKYGTPRF